jgi:multidrug resistance efflux pump
VELGFAVSGQLRETFVRPGEMVKAGKPLMMLDSRAFDAAVVAAQRLVEAETLNREEATRERERANELYERAQLSDHEKQLAEIAEMRAKAALETAKHRLVSARVKQEQATLRAPFDAQVLQVQARPGQAMVSRCQSQPQVVLAQAGYLMARARLAPDQQGPSLDQTVQVQVGGKWLEGRLSALTATQDGAQTGVSMEVVFAIPAGVRPRLGTGARLKW